MLAIETRAFISDEQGNKGQILRGTGEQRQYWGTWNIENIFSIFGEQGNKPIYFRGTREQVLPLGWPHCYNELCYKEVQVYHVSD